MRAPIYIQSKFNIQNYLEWKSMSFSTMMLAVWTSKNPSERGSIHLHGFLFLMLGTLIMIYSY